MGIGLKKRTNILEVSGISLEITTALAQKIFIETGDLPIDKYPALEELAEIITEELKLQRFDRVFAPSQTILCDITKQKIKQTFQR